MQKLKFFLVVALVVFGSYGCATKASFVYKEGPELDLERKELPATVAVLPFKDTRGDENINASLINFIPLLPYGPIDYDRPDSANGFLCHASYSFRPSEDLARALVSELKVNRLFKEVFFTEREREPNVDFYLHGEISRAGYHAKIFSYGLSIYGPWLWFAGLPAGTTSNTLSVKLYLERASDHKTVWRHDISGEWEKIVGLYYNWAADFDGYPLIYKEGIQEAIIGLERELRINKVL